MKQIDSDRASGIIIKGVLYMIIAFGIFGTVMMMTAERRKEFGVLIAIGMQKYKLSYVLVLETIIGIGWSYCRNCSKHPDYLVFYITSDSIYRTGS